MAVKANLKPFSDYASCPKCRGTATKHFCNGLPRNCFIWGSSNDCKIEGEHLHRDCISCGYSWLEACADVKPEASN